MKQDEIRQKLIDGAIHVIAQGGLDKATTKQIGIATKINEGYIYRVFGNKDELFARAFDFLDQELAEKVLLYVDVMYAKELEYETRCRLFFFAVWQFMLGHRDNCMAYIRYYYSPYFIMYSTEDHKNRYKRVVNKFKDAFIDEADVWMILNHILNVLLDFAIKIHSNQMPEDDNYAEHVFRVVYASVKQYFRHSVEKGVQEGG